MKAPQPWTYQVISVRVIDGDTIEALLDLGFHCRFDISMRLDGINAAEHGSVSGDAATAWLTGLVAASKEVLVTTHKHASGDKFGRILAVLWCDGVNVNDLAVSLGHAVPYDGHGPKGVPA